MVLCACVTPGCYPIMYTAWYGSPINMPKTRTDIKERLMSIEQQIEHSLSSRGEPALAAHYAGGNRWRDRNAASFRRKDSQGAKFHGKCFNCVKIGHRLRNFPEKERQQREKKLCSICKKPDHSIEECWHTKLGAQRRNVVEDDDFGPPVKCPAFMVAPQGVTRPKDSMSQVLPE